MALDKMYIPLANDKVEVVDISTPTSPVKTGQYVLPSGVRVSTSTLDSAGNLFVADKDAGRIYKFDPSGTLLNNETRIQGGEGPNSIIVDEDDAVWAFYSNGTDTLKLANAGLGIVSTLSSVQGNLIGVATNDVNNVVIAYDKDTSDVFKISLSGDVLAATTNVAAALLGLPAGNLAQIGTSADKVFLSYLDTTDNKYYLIIYDIDTAGVTVADAMSTEAPVAIFCDGTYVYVSDIGGRIYKFLASGDLITIFNVPNSFGTVTALAVDESEAYLIAVDDGFFSGDISYQIIDVTTGLVQSSTTVPFSAAGRLNSCDLNGFSRFNIVQNIPAPVVVPSFDTDKIYALVNTNGSIGIAGTPGAVSDAATIDIEFPISVDVLTGVPVQTDGSFSCLTAAGIASPAGLEDVYIEANGAGTTEIAVKTLTTPWRYAGQQIFEEDAISALNELIGRPVDILGVPVGDVTDFSTWGGFVTRRLQDIYRGILCLNYHISQFKDIQVKGINVLSDTTFVFQGDTPTINFTAVDQQTGHIIDITGADVTYKVFDAANGDILIFQKDATIISGVNGASEVVLTASDTAQTGSFYGIVQYSLPGGEITTTPRFQFVINSTP